MPIAIGECVTVEAEPDAPDECDDSDPSSDLSAQTMRIQIHRTDAPAEGSFWINVAVDVDGDGRWDPDSEWVVRNCPVSSSGPENEVIECDATDSSLAPSQNGWLRVLLANKQAPASGWDGSAFFEPGEALGEVEDYSQDSVPTPIPPPTLTPTPTPTTTPTPVSGESFTDLLGDSQVTDDEGNFPGVALPEDRVFGALLIWQICGLLNKTDDGQPRTLVQELNIVHRLVINSPLSFVLLQRHFTGHYVVLKCRAAFAARG